MISALIKFELYQETKHQESIKGAVLRFAQNAELAQGKM
jgi:hypothetical protein